MSSEALLAQLRQETATVDGVLRELRAHADPDRLEALLEALLAADGLCSEW